MGPPSEVNCWAFEPSLSQTQISSLPERLDPKTIRLPSGEYSGCFSKRVEEISSFGGPGAGPAPASSMRQMLASQISWAKTRRPPARDSAGAEMASPAALTSCGSPGPVTGTRHRLRLPSCGPDTNRMARPSGVQAGLVDG